MPKPQNVFSKLVIENLAEQRVHRLDEDSRKGWIGRGMGFDAGE